MKGSDLLFEYRLVEKEVNNQQVDLRKEKYFSENKKTTTSEIESIAIKLLRLTWKIDVYRYTESNIINLFNLGWRFEFNNRKRAAGLCSKITKKIYVSRWLLEQNLENSMEFENIIRHELAHALDFEIRGISDHSNVWKLIARQVLCTADRCYNDKQVSVKLTTKYTLFCDSCGKVTPSHKKKKRDVSCGSCCKNYNHGRYSDKYVLRQVQNY